MLGLQQKPGTLGDDDDRSSAPKKPQGILGWIFGSGDAGAAGGVVDGDEDFEAGRPKKTVVVRDITPPASLSGDVEIKGTGTLGLFSTFKPWYLEVRAPGDLYFFKDKKAASASPHDAVPSTDPAIPSMIDLRLIIDFHLQEHSQLLLQTADLSIAIKLKSASESDAWKKLLIEWKDFNMEQGADYMTQQALKSHDMGRKSELLSGSGGGGGGGGGGGASTLVARDDRDETGSDEGLMPAKKTTSSEVAASTSATLYSNRNSNSESVPASSLGDVKPAAIDGYAEMKMSSTFSFSEDWQNRYLRIDEANMSLNVCKTNNPNEKPLLVIPLPEASEIAFYEKGGLDQKRFNIDIGAKSHKFRVSSTQEGMAYVAGLKNWQEVRNNTPFSLLKIQLTCVDFRFLTSNIIKNKTPQLPTQYFLMNMS